MTKERIFNCSICQTTHKITLSDDLADGHTYFPFSYLYLHGPVDDILTTLYIDANLNIRGAESVKLEKGEEDNLMSKAQMTAIVNVLTNELARSQKDFEELQQKYNDLIKKQ